MYVFFRLIAALIRARRAPRLDPRAEFRIKLRIFPNDLDSNLHLNNGRYLTLFDVGRFDLVMRSGLWSVMRKHKWYPVLSGAAIRFKASLAAFESVDLCTRLVYWDDKWIYIEHRLERGGRVCAKGLVKGIFRGPEGNVPVARLLEGMGLSGEAPPEPETVRRWVSFEETLKDEKK